MPIKRIRGESIPDKFNRCAIRNPDGCWGWNGTAFKDKKKNRMRAMLWNTTTKANQLAARVSWRLHNGEIPEGLCVLHHCDNPMCTRPDHLFLGTQKDNMQDAAQKGRHYSRLHPELVPRGERHWTHIQGRAVSRKPRKPRLKGGLGLPRGDKHWAAKLNVDLVKEIRRRYEAGDISQQDLANELGIPRTSISAVINRYNWAWVE